MKTKEEIKRMIDLLNSDIGEPEDVEEMFVAASSIGVLYWVLETLPEKKDTTLEKASEVHCKFISELEEHSKKLVNRQKGLTDEPFPERMILGFDPMNHKELLLRKIFCNQTARILYLLWRSGHIVHQGFEAQVMAIAADIDKAEPVSAGELAHCFRRQRSGSGRRNFPDTDVALFCVKALDYFTGKKEIGWERKTKLPAIKGL